MLALAAAIFGMVNYASFRHYKHADVSRSKLYQLSDKTQGLLKSLTNAIDVIVFLQPGQDIYEDVDNLLKEYQDASKLIRVQKVDPDRDLARTEMLAKKYQVSKANVVVFDNGGRTKFVTAEDIVEMDYSGMQMGAPPRKTGFKGEQAFSRRFRVSRNRRCPWCISCKATASATPMALTARKAIPTSRARSNVTIRRSKRSRSASRKRFPPMPIRS